MAINLKTEEGMEFSFDTVEELMDFKRQLDAEESSKEEDASADEVEIPDNESGIEVGDKVRIVSSEDGTGTSYHGFIEGSIGEVIEVFGNEGLEVSNGTFHQTLLPHHYEKVEIQEEQEYKVGDVVRVIGNSYGHLMTSGEVREITEVDSEEPKYNLSEVSNGYWAGTSDIEPAHSSAKLRTGDIVKVIEEFEDHFGDRAYRGALYDYDENSVLGEPFVGTVFLGYNKDKIELVCRAEDRLDI